MRIITLTTDFGTADPFVGVMKGVILGICAEAALVDLTHEIPPQNVLAGALALEAAVPYFPPGTIHLGVVDPGVGTDRAAIAIESARSLFVGPDNGLFTLALRGNTALRAVRLTNPAYRLNPPSATFHGRDIFAPAAARLAAGDPLSALGEAVDSLVQLNVPAPAEVNGALRVPVLHVDRFGNLITGLTRSEWVERGGEEMRLHAGAVVIPRLSRTYADVAPGQALAYFGSGGRLEVGVRNGSAASELGLGPGDSVMIEILPPGRVTRPPG